MNRTLTALLLLAAASAQAQQSTDDLQRVEVRGLRPAEVTRYDVAEACPGIGQALDYSLSPAITTYGHVGDVRVEFRMSGQRIIEVTSSGGPREYRPAIKRAVRALRCTQNATDERFAFILRFADPDDLPADANLPRVALLIAR